MAWWLDTIQFPLGAYLSRKHPLGFPRALHDIPFQPSCWQGLPSIKTSKVEGGLGKALLKDALARIAQAADIVGARAVLVHAIDQQARKFYEHFDFEPSPVHELQLMLLMKDLRKALE